jgi:hypothetical protein
MENMEGSVKEQLSLSTPLLHIGGGEVEYSAA